MGFELTNYNVAVMNVSNYVTGRHERTFLLSLTLFLVIDAKFIKTMRIFNNT